MLTKAGHDDGVEWLVVGHDPIHNPNRGQVALEIAVDRLSAEKRLESNDFRAW